MRKRILITPLDWGLGHAARCVPLIRYLIKAGHEVTVAADQRPLRFLSGEFPHLRLLHLPGYQVTYPASGRMVPAMLRQAPAMLYHIYRENRQVNRLIEEEQIDLIISDNRFGMWSDKIPCIFITHQLNMQAPRGSWLANKLNSHFFNKYDQIWIPDIRGKENLAGELTNPRYTRQEKLKFIGPLSRFQKPASLPEEKYDFMAIVSGPEPQRSIFEKIIISQLKGSGKKGIIVQGLPGKKEHFQPDDHIDVYSHLKGEDLLHYLLRSKVIIARSGYTTIMEMAALGKKAILIPTPGQTEQEYLAAYHGKQGHFLTQSQNELNVIKTLNDAQQTGPFKLSGIPFEEQLLAQEEQVGSIIQQISSK